MCNMSNSTTVFFNISTTLPTNASLWTLYHESLVIWLATTQSISLFGTILYVLLITVIVQTGEYKKGCGILILHLIFVDMGMVTINIPINILGVYVGQLVAFTPTHCLIIHFPFLLNMNICNYAQMIIAINRCVATIFPHRYKSFVSKPVLTGMIAAAWLVSLANNLPRVLGVEGYFETEKQWKNCGFAHVKAGPFIQAAAFVGVYIPTVGTLLLYLSIFVKIWGFSAKVVDEQDRTNAGLQRAWRRRARMAKILAAVSFWYCLCYYPQNVLGTLRAAVYMKSVAMQLWLRTIFLGGYAMTPVIFFTLNSDYRAGLVALWGKCQRHGRSVIGSLHMLTSSTVTLSRSNKVANKKRVPVGFDE